MIGQIIIFLLIIVLWYMNKKQIENFKQEEILNNIYRDLTLEEFKRDLKESEINVPEKLIKPIFYKFKTNARENKMTVDFAIKKLKPFEKTSISDIEFMKKYLLLLKN